jgi:hypothetical protein
MSGFRDGPIKQTPIAFLTSNIQRVEDRYALKTYVDEKIADVVANAPAVLDTLQELSAALGDNPNLVHVIQSNLTTEITRATTAEQTLSTSIAAIGSGSLTVISTLLGQEIARATAAERTLSTSIIDSASTLQSELRAGLTSTAIYVDKAVSSVVANAPAILDTLSEIAAALDGDPQAVVNLTSSIQASNDYISSTKSELQSTIDYVTTLNTAKLQTHGLQSYNATPQLHRHRHTGPYAPSTFSTLYSIGGKNPYEHLTNHGASIILQPTADDTTTVLPPYTTRWSRIGTLDLTNSSSSAPYNLTTLPMAYSGAAIPYYDIYIEPKTFYGPNTDYGFVKAAQFSAARQLHQGIILTCANSIPYSATPLGGTWSAIYKDDIPELERLINITNINTVRVNGINLLIDGGGNTFEIAPGEKTSFVYTAAGWMMGI